jgi:L-lysine exporter family protein LysE/ArgO
MILSTDAAGALPALSAFVHALLLSLGLIVAIGAQNAFVLRQGLRREHVGSVVALCAACDALLVAAGVFGLAQLIGERRELMRMLALLGALFLAGYGVLALRRAARGVAGLLPGVEVAVTPGRARVLAQAAGFTLLNPHVYLDTVLLLGGIGAAQPSATLRGWFVAGACSASLLWFCALGFGARLLAPWFARPRAWQRLDALIGLTMLALAAGLLRAASLPMS